MSTILTVTLEDTFVLEAYAQCTICLSVATVGSHAHASSTQFSHYIPVEFKIKICCYNQILKL